MDGVASGGYADATGRSISLSGEYVGRRPPASWSGDLPASLSPGREGPSSFRLFSVLYSLGLGICSDYSRDPHSVLFMPFGC